MVTLVKVLLLIFPFWVTAQVSLSPPDCTLECVDRSLKFSSCTQASGGLSDPSVVPCLCEDKMFLVETVNCVINSGKCPSLQDQQRSFIYASGLCDSAGVTLPGASPSDLPSALGVSTSISSTDTTRATSTVPKVSTFVTVIEETITTDLTIETSIACLPPSGNITYIIVVSNNVTKTIMPEPTIRCGNFTKTMKITTTRGSTSTRTIRATSTEASVTRIEGPSATDEGAAGRVGVQLGGILAFVGALIWLI